METAVSESSVGSLFSLTPLVCPTPRLHHLGLPTEQGALAEGQRGMLLGVHESRGGPLSWSETAVLGWRDSGSA